MEEIIKKRKEMKLSQAKFANKFGIPIGTYVQWESGRRKPPQYTIDMILTILNTTHINF